MASLVSFVARAPGLCTSEAGDAGHCPTSVLRRQQQQTIGVKRREDCFELLPLQTRLPRRWSRLSRRAGGAPGDQDDDDKSAKTEAGVKFDDAVDGIQKSLAKSFGGPLWFAILLTLLGVFGGGYVYLIYNYADFSDIPILNGPQM